MGIVLLRLRWKYATRRRLSDQQCQDFAAEMCNELFDLSAGPGEYVKLAPELAETFGRFETIEAIRWMNGRGFTTTDASWDWLKILSGELPTGIALTKREYDKRIQGFGTSNVIYGDGNINNQGIQVVAGRDIEIDGDFLASLANALRADATELAGETKTEALRVADILDAAADGHLNQDASLFKNSIAWVKARINEGVGGAMGAGLWAATAALFS